MRARSISPCRFPPTLFAGAQRITPGSSTPLLMAEFGQPGEPETLIPAVTQEALAEMLGTTRSAWIRYAPGTKA